MVDQKQNLIDEKKRLDAKLSALLWAQDNPDPKRTITNGERALLQRERAARIELSEVLGERIALHR